MKQDGPVYQPHILIAPLDWGLGHATRCIPVIRQLLRANCKVIIGAEGKVKALLQAEFPQLLFLHLPGYNISYSTNNKTTGLKVLLQIPKILKAIDREHLWLQQAVKAYHINAVISDNRYGLYHPHIISVFITHQLYIKTPLGKWPERILQKLNYQYINRFNECWVPDYQNGSGLAGLLSHPQKLPAVPVKYIGTLTRFQKRKEITGGDYLLILLSGPEPQRTILEQLLLKQLKNDRQPVLFVRGLPDETITPDVPKYITIKNHLPAYALEEVMTKASFIISRCGYSTIMDVMALHKKSILIPTPGQTEQEYLAQYLMQQQYALCVQQKKIDLQNALDRAAAFPYQLFSDNKDDSLAAAVELLMDKINIR